MSMIDWDVPKFALARAQLDGEEIVGEVLNSENGIVQLREFGATTPIRVSRDRVEVKA